MRLLSKSEMTNINKVQYRQCYYSLLLSYSTNNVLTLKINSLIGRTINILRLLLDANVMVGLQIP